MDPVTALSTAAAVLQFVGFGTRLLSTSYEIYKSPSGHTAKEVELSTVASDLAGVVGHVRVSAARGGAYRSTAQTQLVNLSSECENIIIPLQEALGTLQRDGVSKVSYEKPRVSGKKSPGKTLRTALEAVWNESKIDGMVDKLETMRRRMMTATLFCLWDESKQYQQREIQFSKRLDDMIGMLKRLDDRMQEMGQPATREAGDAFHLGAHDRDVSDAEEVIIALNDRTSPDALRIHDELVHHLWKRQRSPQQPAGVDARRDDSTTESLKSSFRTAILESVAFETMQVREEAIPKPFEKTFSWIFQLKPMELGGKSMWSGFPQWLASDAEQPYWITGKPGSGKSTLMKFITQHPDLHQHLRPWAGTLPVLVASYYAWISGSDLQKCCEGLMRTLVYQALQLNPSLVPTIAPRRWALLTTFRSVVGMPPWQLWEVEESFETLLSQCGTVTKLALFVDGLDEFESPPVQVIELIQRVNARKGIKICVASRQWTEFNDALKENPMLRMQDLTTADMAHFVKIKLESNPGFLELRTIFPAEAAHLIDDIVKKSSGVFLWIALVVRALLEALTEGDGLPELQNTIDRLPSDIAELYNAIWSSISSRNISVSSQLLALVRAAYGPLHYLTLWLADEKQSLVFDVNSLAPEARAGVADLMKRRLDSRTRGILEISRNGTVDFLHRTARDWVSQPAVWQTISSTIKGQFDPNLLLLKAETLRTADKFHLRNEKLEDLWAFANRSLWYASHVQDSPDNSAKLVRILNMFNNEVDKIADRYVRVAGWYAQLQGTQLRLHWSSCQSHDSLGNRENTFLGLAAQFCILPYLRSKLSSNPDAVRPKASRTSMSLLENAIFGFPGVTDPVENPSDRHFHIDKDKRIETIAFLLENGALPKQPMIGGRLIIDEVRARKTSEKEADGSVYWAKVEELLTRKRGRKTNLKSIFMRMMKPGD